MHKLIFGIFGIFGTATLLAAGCSEDPSALTALGTLERDRIELVADSGEPILQIAVREGELVAAGATVVVQDARRAEAALARATAEQAAAKAALAEAESGPRAQQIEQGRARLRAATSAAQTAHLLLQRELSLSEQDYASQDRVDVLQGQYEGARARQAEADAGLDELLEGTRSEQIDGARSRYAGAQALVSDLAISVERATVRAPVAGYIETLPFEPGERPRAGSTVAVLLAETPVYARVHVPALLRTRLLPGAAAEVRIDGFETPFAGRLRWIAADAAFTPYYALSQYDRSRLSYLAEIDLQGEAAAKVPIGVPVEVVFPQPPLPRR